MKRIAEWAKQAARAGMIFAAAVDTIINEGDDERATMDVTGWTVIQDHTGETIAVVRDVGVAKAVEREFRKKAN